MEVISLLRSRNRCLVKFRDLSAEFLEGTRAGDFSLLELFEVRREATLKALTLYEGKLGEAAGLLKPAQKTKQLILDIESLLMERETLVHEIARIDQNILASMASERTRLLRDLTQQKKSHDVLQKFKSAWIPPAGEELDKKL